MTVAEGQQAAEPTAARPSVWLIVCAAFALIAGVIFVYNGLRYADETQTELRLIPWLEYDRRVDFGYFYAGAEMARRGDAAELYPLRGERTFYIRDPLFSYLEDDYAKARFLGRGNYYNPPALAYLQAPLTLLSFRDAFWLYSGLAVAAMAGFACLAWLRGRQIAELPLVILGVAALKPVHEAIIMGHLTLFFVLALTVGFLLLRARREYLAGLMFALLALKPQWAILPGLFLLVRGEWRALGSMAAGAAAIFFLPFFVTGLDTFRNYFDFLRHASTLDLKDAPHMFSWNGLLSKLDGSEIQDGVYVPYADAPPPLLIYGLIGVTILVLAVVWSGRDYLLGVAATVVAMLLVSTHSVWYDWGLLAVAALFLVLRSATMTRGQRVEMWVVMLVVYLAANQSMGELLYPGRHIIDWHRSAFYAITPAAFLALVWMASLAVRQGGLRLPFSWRPALYRSARGA